MKIYKESEPLDICISEMKDGDIGIITSWSHVTDLYKGTIVQRYDQGIILLGRPSGESFASILAVQNLKENFKTHRVRLLQPGTLIEI
jgi:hypothetical protein